MNRRRGSTVAIVQARTSSRRLPRKVLTSLEGEPMIMRQLERVARAEGLDHIVVATSDRAEDDELTELLGSRGIDTLRGPLDDVLRRFVLAIDEFRPEVVVRLTADCPLSSPTVIDQVVEAFHEGDEDYLSNTLKPTFPDGLDVEVVTAQALRDVNAKTTDPHEREHVTLGVYRRTGDFRTRNFCDPSGADHSDLRWTVDNPDDFAFVETVYGALFPSNPAFDYPDVLAFLDAHPEVSRTAADSPRNAALDGLDTGAMQHQRSGVER